MIKELDDSILPEEDKMILVTIIASIELEYRKK